MRRRRLVVDKSRSRSHFLGFKLDLGIYHVPLLAARRRDWGPTLKVRCGSAAADRARRECACVRLYWRTQVPRYLGNI